MDFSFSTWTESDFFVEKYPPEPNPTLIIIFFFSQKQDEPCLHREHVDLRSLWCTHGKDVQIIGGKIEHHPEKIHPFAHTLFTRSTEYFPHVTGESMRTRFIQNFDAIQGNGGLYYATMLLSMETVDNSIEMGEGIVDKYFYNQFTLHKQLHKRPQ